MFRLVRFFLLAILFVIVAFCLVNPGFYVLEKTNDVKPGTVDNNDVIVYFINMDKSKERLNHILPYVQGLGLSFERIPGVDGNKLSDEEIKEVLDAKSYSLVATRYSRPDFIRKGVVGCSLGHLKAWETFLKSNYKFALILEDDAEFDPSSFRKVIDELTEKYPQKWDVANFFKDKLGRTVTMQDLADGYMMKLDLQEWYGSGAYILNRNAAADFINYFYPIKLPMDLYYGRSWEFGIKFVSIWPFIVHNSGVSSELNSTGEVQISESAAGVQGDIWRLKTKIARVLYSIKLLMMNLIAA